MALLRNDALVTHPIIRRGPDGPSWPRWLRALNSQQIAADGLPINSQGWTVDTVFSSTDTDTVAWTSGTLTTAAGTAYSISGSNTGNMVARTFIYFDPSASETAFQTTTTATDAIGEDRILIAVAEDGTSNAFFQGFGGIGGIRIDDNDIDSLNTTNAPAEAGADQTGNNTANDVNVGGGRNVEESGADKTINNVVLAGDSNTHPVVGQELGTTDKTGNTSFTSLFTFTVNFTGTFRLMVETRKEVSGGPDIAGDPQWRLKNGAGTVIHGPVTVTHTSFTEEFTNEETVTSAGETFTVEGKGVTDATTLEEIAIRDREVRARFNHVTWT